MKATENYSRLWDGSEPGWVVVRHTEDREALHVVFSRSGPTMFEIKALRSVIPTLAEKRAIEVLASFKGMLEFSVGEFESSAARKLRRQFETAGLQVASKAYRVVSHSLINELSKVYLLIEDAAKSEEVAEEAIKQGLPIRHSVV
ncbi:hypothetical protein HNQ51_002697 [Inhella inkyongensis]|uniref:Uncharacterized protein n=1 Tax=Inhella inkyongensis TaxID=392593 RepID=A0A840S790_9BURK|nr:hypothetical protein [Inhella inkyongensis]MBB5205378.1 hypothetical protein [Inhella inkyongensis]